MAPPKRINSSTQVETGADALSIVQGDNRVNLNARSAALLLSHLASFVARKMAGG